MKRLFMCCCLVGMITFFTHCNNSSDSGKVSSDTAKKDMNDTTHRDTLMHTDTGSRH